MAGSPIHCEVLPSPAPRKAKDKSPHRSTMLCIQAYQSLHKYMPLASIPPSYIIGTVPYSI